MTGNPYRPGAAHAPPYLAGRSSERQEFSRILGQRPVLENLVLTGVRGIGKTVLLQDALRKNAIESGWIWVGSDISEAVSVSEDHFAQRLLADMQTISGDWPYSVRQRQRPGFTSDMEYETVAFDYQTMSTLFEQEPGLTSDKLKKILLVAWDLLQKNMPKKKGIIFAWDEAQNLADRSAEKQYPLATMLDVFSSLQSQGIPFMLVLAGLPTLFPKLVRSRTYAERMFRVMTLDNLNSQDATEAIAKPLEHDPERVKNFFNNNSNSIVYITRGYPYFLQFWCRELYDYITGSSSINDGHSTDIIERITHKLDIDFFEARWAKLTDRQRDLLSVIAHLENSDKEFTVQEITEKSKTIGRAFSGSHVNQILTTLFNKGMIFKNRHGKYILAVPLLDEYVRRRTTDFPTHE